MIFTFDNRFLKLPFAAMVGKVHKMKKPTRDRQLKFGCG